LLNIFKPLTSPTSVPKQTESHLLQPCDLGRLRELPTVMAWLGYPLIGLPRSCYRSKVPNSSTLINHADTHHKLRQRSSTATTYKDTYFPSLLVPMSKLKRACWTQTTLSGTLSPPYMNPLLDLKSMFYMYIRQSTISGFLLCLNPLPSLNPESEYLALLFFLLNRLHCCRLLLNFEIPKVAWTRSNFASTVHIS
jgi:hypothetical protein